MVDRSREAPAARENLGCSSSYANDREFTGTVEEITGRRVESVVSGIDTGQDVSSEVFYLEPLTEPVTPA